MLIISCADVYAPEFLGCKDVLTVGGQIEWIRDPLNPEEKKALKALGCQILDAKGKKLFPGLIDRHVHITGGGGEGGFSTKTPEIMLSQLIRGGTTTVVGVLGTDGISRSVENLLSKAKALKEEGLSAYICTGSYGYPSTTLTGDVRKDIMFLEEVLGVKLALSDHRAPNVSTEELIHLASDVRVAGMLEKKPGILVIHMGDDKRGLDPVFRALEETSVPIKTFQPTHVGRNPDLFKQACRFAKMGGYIDFTADAPGEDKMNLFWEKMKEEQVPGDRITISSDGQGSWSEYDINGRLLKIGVSAADNLYRQLVSLVYEKNQDAAEVFSCATVNPAKALELYPKKGAIIPGADADLLLIDENWIPDTVISQGKILMEEGKLLVKGTYETERTGMK